MTGGGGGSRTFRPARYRHQQCRDRRTDRASQPRSNPATGTMSSREISPPPSLRPARRFQPCSAKVAGALVFVSSFVGTSVGLPGMAAYGAAKAGLMGLVKGITADYAAEGIRANALLPAERIRPWLATSSKGLGRFAACAEADCTAGRDRCCGSLSCRPHGQFRCRLRPYADGGNAAVK